MTDHTLRKLRKNFRTIDNSARERTVRLPSVYNVEFTEDTTIDKLEVEKEFVFEEEEEE